MKAKVSLVLVALGFIAPNAQAVPMFATSPELQQVENQLRADLHELVSQKDRAKWMETWPLSEQNADGSFKDLVYNDNRRPDWGPLDTLTRAQWMLLATEYAENPHYKSKKMKDAALRAIRFVRNGNFTEHYNWWHREIGRPLVTYRILLLAKNDLSQGEVDWLMKLTRMGHLTDHPSGWSARGQNLVWFSEITIALGVLFDRPEWIRTAVDALASGITLGHEQGPQVDGTFYQHGTVFYGGGYGLDFSKDMSRLFRIVGGTSLAFSRENYATLAQHILDGQSWLVQGSIIDMSSKGRYYCRPPTGKDELRLACYNMSRVPGARASEFQKCVQNFDRNVPRHRLGNRHFWMGDTLVQNRENFGISVKMHSDRVLSGDTSPMGEGLKSHFLSDGLTYIHRKGDEYNEIYPIWDFLRLPGTTQVRLSSYPIVPDANYWPEESSMSFVGGASDGENGLAYMDFFRNRLKAKKAYFFGSKGMVALGAGIQCSGCPSVHTTINQEWSRSDALQGRIGSVTGSKLASSLVESAGDTWFHAAGVGYLVPGMQNLKIQDVEQTGSWKAIAAQKSDRVVKGRVFSAWIEHGDAPDASYAYAVYPGIDVQATTDLAAQPDFEVLTNTPKSQWVHFTKEKRLAGVFYTAGKLSFPNIGEVEVSAPGALMFQETLKGMTLTVSSPRQQRMTVRWSLPFSIGVKELDLTAGKSVVISVDRQ